jgi:SAM-dependent methyltransferase
MVCLAEFRALLGIPDLRTAQDEFLPNDVDWALATRLAEGFARFDFRCLLEHYFELSPEIPRGLRDRQIAHILTAPGRAGRWLDALGPSAARGPLLDLGCGTGSFLACTAHEIGECCGVDIAMRWLIVARKRLDEEGLSRIPLACACAEALPLPPEGLAALVAGDVIEHVRDQQQTLTEAHRVLRPGGRLFLASPNRFSLAPEPHVQVWGVGFLPRTWMPAYVRAMRGVDFRAIRTLGYGEWSRLLGTSQFEPTRIELVVPTLPQGDTDHFGPVKRQVARAYNAIVRTRPGQWLARAVGPLFHVTCEKAGVSQGACSPSPATRPRSRPSGVRW